MNPDQKRSKSFSSSLAAATLAFITASGCTRIDPAARLEVMVPPDSVRKAVAHLFQKVDLQVEQLRLQALENDLIAIGPESIPALLDFALNGNSAQTGLADMTLKRWGDRAIAPAIARLRSSDLTEDQTGHLKTIVTSQGELSTDPVETLLTLPGAKDRQLAIDLAYRLEVNKLHSDSMPGITGKFIPRQEHPPFGFSLKARETFLHTIQRSPDPILREKTAVILRSYGWKNESIKDDLIDCFKNENSENVKLALAGTLADLASFETESSSRAIVDLITDSIKDNRDSELAMRTKTILHNLDFRRRNMMKWHYGP
ncbi:MAG: hypothetical protein AB7W16_14995 [Candidatus Obscuribacterales bacterium]